MGGIHHGFLWDPGSGFRTVDFPGATETLAYGINAAGTITGQYVGASGATHGFMFDGMAFTAIDFPGAAQTFAFGINTTGQIVGQYGMGGPSHGFLRNPADGTFTTIDVPRASYSEATGISDTGQIVGASSCAMSPSVEGFARIGTTPGKVNFPLSTDTEPLGINGSGQV